MVICTTCGSNPTEETLKKHHYYYTIILYYYYNTLIISNIYFETQKEFFLHLWTNDFY